MPLQLRIRGAENARGKITRFRTTTLDKIEQVLQEEGRQSLETIREAMNAWYTTGEGSGRVANSLHMNIRRRDREVLVSLRVANFRELKYMTTLLPESEFKAGPYEIRAGFFTGGGGRKKLLRFFWKRRGREFRGRAVTHPGFGRDVLRETGNNQLARMGYMVEYTVRSAVAEIGLEGGFTQRVSGRR